MSITSLELFIEHQRLGGDDSLLAQSYLDAAEAFVAHRICAVLGSGEGQQSVTPDITAAILMLAGHLYENREAVVIGTITASVPLAVEAFLAPYRRWDAEP